jgi:DNA topoisomerase III
MAPTSTSQNKLLNLLNDRFGFSEFRPHQEEVCQASAEGKDVLLVMPTGAGKSLCYQLPGIARGGTTLVISPLVALMEDQVTKLQRSGFRAERIHSGRDRADSRAACVNYLSGNLDFLFIAPERLAVPGFLEMLAKRTPSLIAIDEAHCISHWGHDFRPEYRMLGARLPELRPAPIIALTATATEQVQDDIIAQLGLQNASRFMRGFRRTNLAIEVCERKPSERISTILEILREPKNTPSEKAEFEKNSRFPALIYAPTRKEAENIAEALKKAGMKGAAAYHAGLSPELRERIQSEYLSGQTNTVVATVAFGMGVDKADVRTVIHAALPQSVEGYYQEIGRAGRDGKLSRAILLYSYADRRTHEFFLERDYPETKHLEKISIHLKKQRLPEDIETVRLACEMDPETYEKALLKLRVHGGALLSQDAELSPGPNGSWKSQYDQQRNHRLKQMASILRYSEQDSCRMVGLIRHFGEKDQTACGLCDHCAPGKTITKNLREESGSEERDTACILKALHRFEREEPHSDGMGTGKLFQSSFTSKQKVERREFEHLLKALHRGGYVRIEHTSFEKDGKTIAYQRASLTHSGMLKAQASQSVNTEGAFTTRTKAKPSSAPKTRRRRTSTPRSPSYEF